MTSMTFRSAPMLLYIINGETMENRTILAVDDAEENLDILSELLSSYHVIGISNGQEALQLAKKEKIDLILLDIMMPDMDGYEVCQKLKQDPDTQHIPVIFLTAKTDIDSIETAYNLGGIDYITKPFKPQELLSRIKTQLDMQKLVIELERSKKELKHLNNTLETKVQEQVEKLDRQHMLIAQKSRLESMGEMINIIVHQWRQPLNRINSNLAVMDSMIRRGMTDSSMMEAQSTKIKQNTKYMSETIADFANFFHPDKKVTYFLIQDVIDKALELLEFCTNNIEINIICTDTIEVSSFEKEYLQVMLIILNNAIDNFESKAIEEPKIDIVMKVYDGIAMLSICDNGGGIDKGDIDRIFDPYYTTKFAREGTGLGLYMAKMIIENSMHGQLQVKNQNGGACFEITIPQER